MTRSARFLKNFSWNLSGQVALALLNFAFIPFLVRRLGLERYGLYVLLFAATNYLSLFAFGAGSTTVKFVAESVGARDGKGLRQTLWYSAAIHALGALVAGGALAAAAPWLAVRLFHIEPGLLSPAVFVLRCAAAAAFFWAMAQWGASTLQGLQRFDAHNAVSLLQNGLVPIGAAALVAAGFGLKGAAAWYVAANAAGCLAALIAARRLLQAALALPEGKGLTFRRFSSWSLSMWLGPLAWLIIYQFDKVLIARAASLTALTLYAVPAGLLQRLQVLPVAVSSVSLPMMTEAAAGPDKDLRTMYLKSQRFLLWLMLPVLAGFLAMMPQFLGLWLGAEFAGRSVWPARLIVLAQVFMALNPMAAVVAISRDRPLWPSAVAWIQALTSLVAWRLLIPGYGLLGVAAGSLIAQSVPTLFYLAASHGLVKISWAEFWGESVSRPLLAAAAMGALLLAVHERATSWPALVLIVGCGASLYGVLAWLWAKADDKAVFMRVLRLS